MATHSSILAWKIPLTENWWATAHGITKTTTEQILILQMRTLESRGLDNLFWVTQLDNE